MIRSRETVRAPSISSSPTHSSGGESLLEMRSVTCAIGRRTIFDEFSLDVESGERVHLGGVNGAGKTTVLRCIGGTMPISYGTADIGGHPVGSGPARRLTGICIEPERGLYLNLSGHDNLVFAARLRVPRLEVQVEVDNVEKELGISAFAHEKVRHYSAGMRTRVAIARALLGSITLLLLDEPTRSLDEDGRARLWSALSRRSSLACVITSHFADDRSRCDRSLVLAGQR